MPVTKEQVIATARLSRLVMDGNGHQRSTEEIEAAISLIAAELAAVVGYMDILDQVDTTNVEPLYSPMQHIAGPREDVATKLLTAEEILAGAPQKHQTFFVVPQVIG